MRKIILHAFPETSKAVKAFKEAGKSLTFQERSFASRLSIESAEQTRFFRRVACLEDVLELTGFALAEVRWYYAPTEDVVRRVACLVRSPQHA